MQKDTLQHANFVQLVRLSIPKANNLNVPPVRKANINLVKKKQNVLIVWRDSFRIQKNKPNVSRATKEDIVQQKVPMPLTNVWNVRKANTTTQKVN